MGEYIFSYYTKREMQVLRRRRFLPLWLAPRLVTESRWQRVAVHGLTKQQADILYGWFTSAGPERPPELDLVLKLIRADVTPPFAIQLEYLPSGAEYIPTSTNPPPSQNSSTK